MTGSFHFFDTNLTCHNSYKIEPSIDSLIFIFWKNGCTDEAQLHKKGAGFLNYHLYFFITLVHLLECQEALGMENNAISNGHISASSHRRSELAPFNGRLHFTGGFGAWRAGAEDVNQWLQVDLGSVYTEVTGVATQGRHTADWPMWVTKYKLQYSDDGLNFQYYTEQGQSADKVK